MATLLKDGRWQARLRTPQGRLAFYGRTEQEADEARDAYIRSTEPFDESATLSEFAKRSWWPGVEASTADNTRRKYLSDWQKWIKPRFGAAPVSSIRREDVQALIGEMQAQGKARSTIKNVVAMLSGILNIAEDDGLIPRNPCRRLKMPPKAPARKRSVDASKAREILERTEGPTRAAAFFALMLGLREGEISALEWSQLDRVAGVLTVDRQHTEVEEDRPRGKAGRGKGRDRVALKVAPTKTRESRRITIPREYVEAIDTVGDLDSRWIVSEHGRPLSPTAIRKRWNRVRDGLGMDGFTFHDLRHCAAGLLHSHDAQEMTIKDTLGHRNMRMTELYVEVADETQRSALKRVAEAVLAPKQVDGAVD